jgi:hypothetical protein
MNSTGSHNDYHQPSDEADTIDHRGIVAIAKLGFLIAAQAAEDIADLSADVDPSKDSARESADALGIVPSATALRSGLLGGLRTR